jgi:hypothetical protein
VRGSSDSKTQTRDLIFLSSQIALKSRITYRDQEVLKRGEPSACGSDAATRPREFHPHCMADTHVS